MSDATCPGEWPSETTYYPACQGGRSLNGDLLAENRARLEFKTFLRCHWVAFSLAGTDTHSSDPRNQALRT
jgi:hypothetical protein